MNSRSPVAEKETLPINRDSRSKDRTEKNTQQLEEIVLEVDVLRVRGI
jgi:hypothetical protein